MGGSRARQPAGEDVQDLPGGEGVAAHPDRQERQDRCQQDGRPRASRSRPFSLTGPPPSPQRLVRSYLVMSAGSISNP